MHSVCSVNTVCQSNPNVRVKFRGFYVSGTAAIAMVAVCMISIVDSPEDIGLTAPHASMRRDDKGNAYTSRKLSSRDMNSGLIE